MEQVRLIGLTAALSFLIWIVADYSLSETVTLQLQLEPHPAAADVRVDIEGESAQCEAMVTGKRTVIAALKSRGEPLPVRFAVHEHTPGEHDLDIKEALVAAEGDLAQLIVQDVNPRTLTVRVDRDKTVTMPVSVSPGTLEYEGRVVVEPRQVSVTMSELDYDKLDAADQRVVVDPDEYLRTAPRGELQRTVIPLRPTVGGFSATLDPDVVTIKYKLAEQLHEWEIPAVPIKIEASLELFNRYRVEPRDAGAILTQTITVRARTELLERIKNNVVRITGKVTLTAGDQADLGQFRYYTPEFNLPEGVVLISEPEPIELRLVPVDAEPARP